MSTPHQVAVIVGSLRKDSINRRIARKLMDMAPTELSMSLVEIGDLPLYNADLETEAPAAWTRFRDQLKASQAVLFVTPEYNRSVPGALKNAIDVGSRPMGASVWGGKPAAVVTASPGALGGFGANHHLRQSLVVLNMPTMAQPEAYFGHADKLLDDQGGFANEGAQTLFEKFIDAYASWVTRLA